MTISPPSLLRAQLDGDDLAGEAFSLVLAALDRAGGDERNAIVKRLPQPWRAVYTTFWLECEVNNGGHHQFFWNSDGGLNEETLADLRLIEAAPFVALFEAALQVYGRYDYQDEKASSGNTWEAFTEGYREQRMEDIDRQFFGQPAAIADFLCAYIRAHPELYVTESR